MFPDVFKPDLFTTTSLTAAINKAPYVPGILGGLGLFEEAGVATTSVVVERVDGKLALVQTSKRGGVGATQTDDKRKGYIFQVPHLQKDDSLLADSVQNVREFGSSDQTRAVESVRDEKLAMMARDLDFTLEHHRLGAVQGRILDADGTTTLLDLFTAFGVAEPTEVDFDLDNAAPASGALRTACTGVVRSMEDALQGLPFTGIHALCGNTFWDQLTAHKEVRETFLNQQEASELRRSWLGDTFHFGGIDFQRYRGSGAVAVGATKCRFFARGVPGLFVTRFAPADYIETVNTLGLPRYAKAEPMKFGKGLDIQAQSNPINICTIPETLLRARNT